MINRFSLVLMCLVLGLVACKKENGTIAAFEITVSDVSHWKKDGEDFSLTFTAEKSKELCDLTRMNVGKNVEFYFEEMSINAPKVSEAICSGKITFFNFEQQEAVIRLLKRGGR